MGISTHSPEANACQQPSEGEGSWQTQRKIGRRLRGARGATWLERFASLTAGAIMLRLVSLAWMVPCPLLELSSSAVRVSQAERSHQADQARLACQSRLNPDFQ